MEAGLPLEHADAGAGDVPAIAHIRRQDFFEQTRADIHALPVPAVELAAALVAVQVHIPKALVDWLIAELGQRGNLSRVTPVALAAMKIGGVSNFLHAAKTLPDNTPEYSLLKALGKEGDLRAAVEFLARFVGRLVEFASQSIGRQVPTNPR